MKQMILLFLCNRVRPACRTLCVTEKSSFLMRHSKKQDIAPNKIGKQRFKIAK